MNGNSNATSESSKRGLTRDLTRLKQDGSASVAEVREFVRQMRGKSPAEVLGSVAQSSLTHGVVVATVATVILMVIFTAGPYVVYGKAPAKKPAAPAAAAEPAKPAEAAPAAAAAETTPAESKQPSKAAVDVLGENEAKESAPDKNPLEDKGDDLLKDLK
jgi:hypothetical protein